MKRKTLPPLARNLRAARAAVGMTQQAVADAIRVTWITYQRWEAGRHTPDLKTLIRVAHILDTTASSLIS
jgi:DNA-binding XRE family transcriptional regulator